MHRERTVGGADGGSRIVGLVVPQGNTTVEPEFVALFGLDPVVLTTRVTSRADGLEQRLEDYGAALGARLQDFGPAPLAVGAFACTGCAYLRGLDGERAALAGLARERGFPVVSAATAVAAAFHALQVRRIALVTPYPEWLTARAVTAWAAVGVAVHQVVAPPAGVGFHPIYTLDVSGVRRAVADVTSPDVDAVLLAGTGMPSLPVLFDLPERSVPVLSSNLCSAWLVTRLLERGRADAASLRPWLSPSAPWRRRLRALSEGREGQSR